MDEVAAQRSSKCRAHAEQCRAQAELSQHPRFQAGFLAAAREWERLAVEIEQIERLGEYARNKSRLVPPPGQDKVD